MFKMRFIYSIFLIFILSLIVPKIANAGVVNPDISLIAQVIAGRTDDSASPNANKNTLNLGETELVLESYLNPYSRGTVVFTVEDSTFSVEEAYINIFKGLPDGFALKAGKYRIGFGKLNPLHPHAYDFIDAPKVMGSMLPGDDGYNDIGAQISYMIPTKGTWASIISADILNGSSWHPNESQAASGWVGRWSNSFLIEDKTPLDIGFSATQGTNNVQWNKKTQVYGADIKTKIPFNSYTKLILQGEYFYNDSDVIVSTTTGSFNRTGRSGFYAFWDLYFMQRWNAGILYSQYTPQENISLTDSEVTYFVGFSFLEETTLLRLAYNQFIPQGAPVNNTVTLQLLFSMGPHKAHQF